MLLHPEERHKLNLDHARWRVSFIISLLQAHRKLMLRRDDDWRARETSYLQQLAAAQTELDLAEADLSRSRASVTPSAGPDPDSGSDPRSRPAPDPARVQDYRSAEAGEPSKS